MVYGTSSDGSAYEESSSDGDGDRLIMGYNTNIDDYLSNCDQNMFKISADIAPWRQSASSNLGHSGRFKAF